jgi:hypothetical protein
MFGIYQVINKIHIDIISVGLQHLKLTLSKDMA